MNTTKQSGNQTNQSDDCGCNDCKDKDNATQLSITTVRATLCDLLYDTRGIVANQETKFDGENEIFNEKKCIFINTEKSYRRFRNFEISTGIELIQTNDSIKVNVNQLKDWNKALNKTLLDLFKQIKEVKGKFIDLKDSAGKLYNSYNDKCFAAQKRAITGRNSENCDEPPSPTPACQNAANDIDDLICIPKGLAFDIDHIFQASSDVIGIQLFSNIDSLDQLQKDLSIKSIAFEKLISDSMKARRTDLDKIQDDLVISVKSVTQAAMERNTQRANFEGYYDTTKFVCCPSCSCVPPDEESNDNSNRQQTKDCNEECPPRLENCEQEICDICEDVKKTFCCSENTNTQPNQQNCD